MRGAGGRSGSALGWGWGCLVPAGGLQSRASLSFLSSQVPMQTCHPRPAARLPSSSLVTPWVVRWACLPVSRPREQ